MEIIAARNFNLAYIILDSIFLLVFAGLLLYKKRRLTLIWGLFGGVLYFAVDYGIFHLLTHSRAITDGSMFWVLLWMSMSYGFTNFAWIWLALKRDEYIKEWTFLIFVWWIACPILAKMFPSTEIHIERTTGAYHGIMGAILFCFLSCGDNLQLHAERQVNEIQYSLAFYNRRSRSARLGVFPTYRRHTERRVYGRTKDNNANRQQSCRNELRLARNLSYLPCDNE